MIDDVWADLVDLSRGDSAQAAVIRMNLRKLAERPVGDPLREMARNVLSGRLSLREAASSETYGHEFSRGFVEFYEKFERLSEEDRQRVVNAGKTRLEQIRRRIISEGTIPP